jgi:hypothetical protein
MADAVTVVLSMYFSSKDHLTKAQRQRQRGHHLNGTMGSRRGHLHIKIQGADRRKLLKEIKQITKRKCQLSVVQV